MFAASALDAGVAAISALPLRVGAERIGTMNLYRDQPGPLSPSQLADALAVANLIAQAVLALQAHAPTETLAPRLADVPFRAVVHQATGMISAQLDIGVAEALIRLRSCAYAQDRPIDEIAALVVAGNLRFDDQPD
jgi:GAF domain-containing protein